MRQPCPRARLARVLCQKRHNTALANNSQTLAPLQNLCIDGHRGDVFLLVDVMVYECITIIYVAVFALSL